MKTLMLTRHARAVKEGYDRDFTRSLKPRGAEEARMMGKHFRHCRLTADRCLTSPALRALQTAELIADQTHEPVLKDDRLYMGGVDELLRLIAEQPDTVERLRVVGHNPDLEDLAARLIRAAGGAIHLAPGATLCLSCDCEGWPQLSSGSCRLEWHLTPDIL